MTNHPPARMAGALGLGLAGALVLSGCTGSEDDPPVPSTTSVTSTASVPTPSTTSATPTTSATSAGMPDAAKQKSKAGAEAFSRFFLAELNRAWSTPKKQILVPLCLNSSRSCAAFQETASTLEMKQQRYAGDAISVDATQEATQSGSDARVLVAVRQNKTDVLNKDGSVAYTDQEKDLVAELTLRWGASGWQVALIKVGRR